MTTCAPRHRCSDRTHGPAALAARRPEMPAHRRHPPGTVTAVHRKRDGFEFVVTPDGDGTVPLSMAVLPGSQAWTVAEKHGGLPNNGRVISAVVDLLRTGSTQRLQTATRAQRRGRRVVARTLSEAALRRVAPQKVRWQDLSPDARRRLLEPVVSPEFHGAVAPETCAATRRNRLSQASRVLEIRLSRRSIVDADARALVLGVLRNVDPSGGGRRRSMRGSAARSAAHAAAHVRRPAWPGLRAAHGTRRPARASSCCSWVSERLTRSIRKR